MSKNSQAEEFDVRIFYIYYEIAAKNNLDGSLKHAIEKSEIIRCFEENNYTLTKKEIVDLIINDGGLVYEDSLRIYDDKLDASIHVKDHWEINLDRGPCEFSLLFFVKPMDNTIKTKFNDISKSIGHLTSRLNNLEGNFASSNHVLFDKVEDLREKTKTLYKTFHRIFQNNGLPTQGQSSSQGENNPFNIEDIWPDLANKDRLTMTQDNLNKNISSNETKKGVLDIALMYSEPLARKEGFEIKVLGDPVSYEEECSKIMTMLKKKDQKATVYFEIATINNLVNILTLSPTILHIMCHGDFNRKTNQFYLHFEENGKLVELYSKDLKNILEEVNFSTKLVFTNACHSEEVAQVFVDAGVPCVVAIQSELKIDDSIAQKFSDSFYWQLFEGETIQDAFNHAKASVTSKDIYTCCCAHKHTNDCVWYKKAKTEGLEKAHDMHTPKCKNCNVVSDELMHNENCEWVQDFLMWGCDNFDLPKGPLKACCCAPHLPHNEKLKFKLISKDEKARNEKLFPESEKGEVTIGSKYSCVQKKFPIAKNIGYNKEMYNLFSSVISKERRIMNLYGIEGLGKTTLVKKLANYLVERGFFSDDKIYMLSLHKAKTITHFRSILFKEVPQASNLKTFYNTLGAEKVLFILVKCDDLINNCFMEFTQDLAVISEHVPNSKFLIVTNKKIELGLEESHEMLDELDKLTAAKILQKDAYLHLTWDQRSTFNLANSEIFKLMPLTPKNLWLVSEKLKGKQSLQDIEREFILQRTNNERVDLTNELDNQRCKLLENIKRSHEDAYNILMFISQFPSGLSYKDLEEISERGWISENWAGILLSLLLWVEHKDDFSEPEEKNNQPMPIEPRDFKIDKYIFLEVTKDIGNNDIMFLPTQFTINYIEKNSQMDLYELRLRKLEYLAMLTRSLIERIKRNNYYNEKLLEFSFVSSYGLWEVSKYWSVNTDEEPRIKYLEGSECNFEQLKKWFLCHEFNFLSCFDLEILDNMIKSTNHEPEKIVKLMETLCLAVPTLEKIINFGDLKYVKEVSTRVQHVINKLEKDVSVLSIKLNLFLLALYLSSKHDFRKNSSLAEIQLKLIQEKEEAIKDQDVRSLVFCEILFAEALYYYKRFKHNCLNAVKFPNKASVYRKMDVLLTKAEKLITPLLKNNETLKVVKAKITLAQYKISHGQRHIDEKYSCNITEALSSMENYGSPKLQAKAHYIYACRELEGIKAGNSKISQENSLSYKKEIRAKLVELRELLTKASLSVAQKLNNKQDESRVKEKIEEIDREIQNVSNIIIVMRALPIVDIQEINTITQISSIGFPTRLVSTFKSDLIGSLKSLNTDNIPLCLKFGLLTKTELFDSFKSGCKVLQLNCNYSEQEYLCIEGSNGVVERVSFEEIRDAFLRKMTNNDGIGYTHNNNEDLNISLIKMSPSQDTANFNDFAMEEFCIKSQNQIDEDDHKDIPSDDIGVDVLILGMKNNRRLADLFVELGIQHIVTFEFSSFEANFRFKVIEDQYMEQFSLYFYEGLIASKEVDKAFKRAYDKVLSCIAQKFFEGKPDNEVADIIGKGAILLPQNGNHSRVIFIPSSAPSGHRVIEDISAESIHTNIAKRDSPFTGRSTDLYQVFDELTGNCNILELKGEHGIGKTAFALHLGCYILSRGIFTDGVFYVPIKALNEDYNIMEFLRAEVSPDIDSDLHGFFEGKKMLLIFDDFDLLSEEDEESFEFLFHTLRECEIRCLVITETQVGCEKILTLAQGPGESEGTKRINTHELKGFSQEELAYIVQSVIVGGDNEDCPTLEHLKACNLIAEAQGNPMIVIKALVNGEIEVKGKVLKILPCYEQSISCEDKMYLMQIECESQLGSKSSRKSSFRLSRRPSEVKDQDIQNDLLALNKRVSKLETSFSKILSYEHK